MSSSAPAAPPAAAAVTAPPAVGSTALPAEGATVSAPPAASVADASKKSSPTTTTAAPKKDSGAINGRTIVPLETDISAIPKREVDLAASHSSSNGKFEDPDFPADMNSIVQQDGIKKGFPPQSMIRWTRLNFGTPPPQQQQLKAGDKPQSTTVQLIGDGLPSLERPKILKNELFLGALACVATRPQLLSYIFSSKNIDKGICSVRFFYRSQWITVCLDDRLPCSLTGTLLFSKSATDTYACISLIEKAYAKLNGGYERLKSGSVATALRDLTGGWTRTLSFSSLGAAHIASGSFWQQLREWLSQGTLITCTRSDSRSDFSYGIVPCLPYTILDARAVEGHNFVKVYSPWLSAAWKGPWSEGAIEWLIHPLPPGCGVSPEDSKGQMWWMKFEDLVKVFDDLCLCSLLAPTWQIQSLSSSWTAETAGGRPEPRDQASWLKNPAFVLHATTKTQAVITLSVSTTGNSSSSSSSFGFIGMAMPALSGGRLTMADVAVKGIPFRFDRDVTTHDLVLLSDKTDIVIVPMAWTAGTAASFEIIVQSSKPISIKPVATVSSLLPTGVQNVIFPLSVSLSQEDPPRKNTDPLPSITQPRTTLADALTWCKENQKPFEDWEFAPDPSLLWKPVTEGSLIWKRLSEHAKNPTLFKDGATAGDLVQGDLPDGWLLSGLATVSTRSDFIESLFVVPPAPFTIKDCEKFGVFAVKFFRNGRWVEVIVDDRVPFVEAGGKGRFLYSHCADADELWVAVMEKACAKLVGGYGGLEGGCVSEAIRMMAPGITQQLRMDDEEVASQIENRWLWQYLKGIQKGESLISLVCTRERPGSGLLVDHAYAVTAMYDDNKRLWLMVLRNSWGVGEWTGAWSDESPEWRDPKNAQAIASIPYNPTKDDGIFVMTFDDIANHFDVMYATRVIPATWHKALVDASWIAGVNAGGSCRHLSWNSNPRFEISVTTRTSVFVVLTQKSSRSARQKWNDGLNSIGFMMLKSNNNANSPFVSRRLPLLRDIAASSLPFRRDPEVSLVFPVTLEPATQPYAIIPMTFEPNEEGSFLLSIYSTEPVQVRDVAQPSVAVSGMDGDEGEEDDQDLEEQMEEVPPEDPIKFCPASSQYESNPKKKAALPAAPTTAAAAGGTASASQKDRKSAADTNDKSPPSQFGEAPEENHMILDFGKGRSLVLSALRPGSMASSSSLSSAGSGAMSEVERLAMEEVRKAEEAILQLEKMLVEAKARLERSKKIWSAVKGPASTTVSAAVVEAPIIKFSQQVLCMAERNLRVDQISPKLPALVLFYSPRCIGCKALSPAFSAAASSFTSAKVAAVTWLAVNALENPDLCKDLQLAYVPTMLWFAADSKGSTSPPIVCEGCLDALEIENWVRVKLGLKAIEAKPETTTAEAGVPPLNEVKNANKAVRIAVARNDTPKSSASATTAAPIRDPEGENKLKQMGEELRKSKVLFADPDFPPDKTSLCIDGLPLPPYLEHKIEWRRPDQFGPKPTPGKAFVDGVKCTDILQGALGNCYFLAALSLCAERSELIEDLIVEDCADVGLYGVKFFEGGKWKTVTVDDRFPCVFNGSHFEPLFSSSVEASDASAKELWVMLAEKAFAKLNGGYWGLEAGRTSDALSYLADTHAEVIQLDTQEAQAATDKIWEKLIAAQARRTSTHFVFLTCGGVKQGEMEGFENPNNAIGGGGGLVTDHAYALLKAAQFGKERLVQLRNPWGRFEWKGDWSDESPKWTPELKLQAEFVAGEDGVFWMSFTDFCRCFGEIEICESHTNPIQASVSAKWTAGVDAAGPSYDMMDLNPRYQLKLDGPCDTSVTLEIESLRRFGGHNLAAGLRIAKLVENELETISLSPFSNVRRIQLDLKASDIVAAGPPPTIVIQPILMYPGVELNYSLFIYSPEKCVLEKMAFTPSPAQTQLLQKFPPVQLRAAFASCVCCGQPRAAPERRLGDFAWHGACTNCAICKKKAMITNVAPDKTGQMRGHCQTCYAAYKTEQLPKCGHCAAALSGSFLVMKTTVTSAASPTPIVSKVLLHSQCQDAWKKSRQQQQQQQQQKPSK